MFVSYYSTFSSIFVILVVYILLCYHLLVSRVLCDCRECDNAV